MNAFCPIVAAAGDFAAVGAAGTLLPRGWVNATIDTTLKLFAPATYALSAGGFGWTEPDPTDLSFDVDGTGMFTIFQTFSDGSWTSNWTGAGDPGLNGNGTSVSFGTVPAPFSLALLGLGLVALGIVRRRKID